MSVFDNLFKLNTKGFTYGNPKLEMQQRNRAMGVIQAATHNKLSITEAERVYDAIATKAMLLPTNEAKIKEAMSILTEMKANWLTTEEKENFVAGVWLCECGKDSQNNSGLTYINAEELQYTRKAILGVAFKDAAKATESSFGGAFGNTFGDYNL